MIRREVGNEFFLITQHDHAALSGQLAQRFGNMKFVRPRPWESVITGVGLHDCGWPIHDDSPTVNDRHQPLDVFETPRSIAMKVWTASAERAVATDPYAGLLVSLHVLSLSVLSAPQHEKMDAARLTERFEINKFQHREVERQERLRRQLGLRTDLPLTLGLAAVHASDEDDQLLFNFRLLQAMDFLSLALCCTQPPGEKSMDLFTSPGNKPTRLSVFREGISSFVIDPWPFDGNRIDLHVAVRKVPGRRYEDDADLRQALSYAAIDQLSVSLVAP